MIGTLGPSQTTLILWVRNEYKTIYIIYMADIILNYYCCIIIITVNIEILAN